MLAAGSPYYLQNYRSKSVVCGDSVVQYETKVVHLEILPLYCSGKTRLSVRIVHLENGIPDSNTIHVVI